MKKVNAALKLRLLLCLAFCLLSAPRCAAQRRMMFGDTTRVGVPYAKDPHVIRFRGRYLMYYSIPPRRWKGMEGWNIGIAESRNLIDWKKTAEITPQKGLAYEAKGLCAPCAIVKDGRVHLFYQTYGNGPKDAICHAVSRDGITFKRDATNPIFHPEPSAWSCGRAIDADVAYFKGKYYLYFATRDPEFKIQKMGVAVADGNTDFSRKEWKLAADRSILYPHLPWEGECIEAPSAYVRNDTLYMFYAGGYNNAPQQIGVARSTDGINFIRMSFNPFKPAGKEGEWNHSESGHPHLFADRDGRTYLFYQGNNDNGRTWKITQEEVGWDSRGVPQMAGGVDTGSNHFEEYDDMPRYVDGDSAAREFIKQHLRYPDNGGSAEGTVLVSLLVDLDDSVSDYKIAEGMGGQYDEEAMRVVKMMRFKAGSYQLKPSRYYVAVRFSK